MLSSSVSCLHRTLRLFAAVALMMCALTPAAPAAEATNTTLVLSAEGNAVNTVAAGTVVTLTASVTVAGQPVTKGQVEFCNANAPHCTDIHLLATAQLTQAGSASLHLRPGVGRSSYRAIFLPSAGHAGSVSGVAALTAEGSVFANTATVLSSVGGPGNYQLKARVTATGVSPTSPAGSVSFRDTTAAEVATAMLGPSLRNFALQGDYISKEVQSGGALLTADFNGDGVPDLAEVNNGDDDSPGSLLIRLGKEDGTFTALPPDPALSGYVLTMVAGDFNGDGKIDLAVANSGNNSIDVLLGEGDGTFTRPISSTAGGGPFDLAVGDFNKDGNQDIAMLNYDFQVTILLGKGDGKFTAAPTIPFAISIPGQFTVGDFNHEGHLDLAVVDNGADSAIEPLVQILLGTGDGGFETGAAINLEVVLDHYFQTGSFVTGDFNGDGNLDIAAAGNPYNAPGTSLCMLLGDGKGNFTEASACQPIAGTGIAMGDFNADGIPDLAVALDSGVSVLLGKGDGTFSSPIFRSTGQPAEYLTAGDYNGDGLPDLGVANGDGSVSILTSQFIETATATASVTLVGTGTHPIYAKYSGTATTSRSASKIIDLAGVGATATTLGGALAHNP